MWGCLHYPPIAQLMRIDIVMHEKENKTRLLVETSVSDDANVQLKESGARNEYEDTRSRK